MYDPRPRLRSFNSASPTTSWRASIHRAGPASLRRCGCFNGIPSTQGLRARIYSVDTRCAVRVERPSESNDATLLKGGEDYQFGNFSLRVIRSLHSPLLKKRYNNISLAGEVPRELKPPLHESAFAEGGSLIYLVRIAGHQIFIMGCDHSRLFQTNGIQIAQREMWSLTCTVFDQSLLHACRDRRRMRE